jgi:ribosomal protein S18 acetylase RimI-like enzyme
MDIVRGSLDNFEEIVALSDECFPHAIADGGMLASWPHCFIRSEAHLRQFLLIKDRGRIVSMLAYIPQTLKVGGRRLAIASVTSVATKPTHRGRGFMTALLHECDRCMQKEGFAFAVLGGDRLWYNRFGWENGGSEWRFEVAPRRVAEGEKQPYSVRRYTDDDVDDVIGLHSQEQVGLERPKALYPVLLGRAGCEAWVAQSGETVVAYLVCYQTPSNTRFAHEYGGITSGIDAIVGYLVHELDTVQFEVNSPRYHSCNSYWAQVSRKWSATQARMIKIVDLEQTLVGFSDQMGSRFR